MSFPIAVYLWSHKGNSQHGQHLNLRSSSAAPFRLTGVWIRALFMIKILICILQSNLLLQRANTMSPHLKKKKSVLFHNEWCGLNHCATWGLLWYENDA